jgi:hypothetical protein
VLLTERHADQIGGVLSCYDRLIVQGTLPIFCSADGMTAYLSKRRIRRYSRSRFSRTSGFAGLNVREQVGQVFDLPFSCEAVHRSIAVAALQGRIGRSPHHGLGVEEPSERRASGSGPQDDILAK